MTYLKRFSLILLSVILLVSFAVPAFAVDITIDDGNITGATYKAYRLLNATNAADADGNATDKFAYTVNTKYRADLMDALDLEDTTDKTCTDAEIIEAIEAKRGDIQNFAQALYAEIKNLDADATAANNAFTSVDQGYYLIVETATGNTPAEDKSEDVFSLVMLDTAGLENIEVKTKEERPTLKKEISGDNNTVTGDIAEDNLSDNVSVGSLVEFTVTATVPNHANYYDYYYFIVEDTLSEGLTYFEDETHKLSVNNGAEADMVIDTDYKLYTGEAAGDKTFQVALLNAKANAGKTITVKYWATLNEKAVVGEEEGNPNTVGLTYSNNPNFDYERTNHPDKPGYPKEDSTIPLGNTPEYVTRTYTTGIKLIKVDQDGNPLTGAEFEIKGQNVVKVLVVKESKYEEAENGEFWKLKDGTYTNQAPQTDRYVEITDGSRDGGYVKDGETYKAATTDQLADNSIKLYKLAKGSVGYYENATQKYALKSYTYEVKEPTGTTAYKAEVDANGYLVVAGLGEGEYTITETKTPAGYNTIDPIKIKIEWDPKADSETDCDWSATIEGRTGTIDVNGQGVFELEVVNNSGAELPSTGGMGTTLFYIVGGLLALAAVVLLVTKKRMSSES